jgi:predicted lipid-binding transport protein (Tim44 family)
MLQVLLVIVVSRLIFAWWQRRNLAAAPSYAASNPATGESFGSFSGILNSARSQPAGGPLTIAKSDYEAFERLLGDVQTAYSAEDLPALRTMITPEMLSYFSEELAANASRGLINRVTDVKLLQGDLAEAWRQARNDYATVAMRFALKDSMVDRASGRIIEGGERSEVTELWTFVRVRAGNWLLSAIQQS